MPLLPPDTGSVPTKAPANHSRALPGPGRKFIGRNDPPAKAAKLLLVLLVLYHLTGFFIIPYLLVTFTPLFFADHPELQGQLTGASFNPYTLRLELSGLEVKRTRATFPTAESFFTFDYLLLDLEWRSLHHRAVLVQEARLEQLTFDLVLEESAGAGESQPPAPAWPSWLRQLPFALQNLVVLDSRITITDLESGASHRLEQISLTLPLFGNLPSGVRPAPETTLLTPEFSALLNGQTVNLKGGGEPGRPVTSSLNLDFQGLDLTNRLNFILPRGLRISQGMADLEAGLALPEAGHKTPLIFTLRGRLTDLELHDAGHGTLLFPSVFFALELTPLQGSYRFRELRLKDPRLSMGSGEENADSATRLPAILRASLARLLTRAPDLSLDQLTVAGGILHLDQVKTGSPPACTGLTLEVSGLNRDPQQPGTFVLSYLDRDGHQVSGQGNLSLSENRGHGHFQLANPPLATLELPLAPGSAAVSLGGITHLAADFSLAPAANLPTAPLTWELIQVALEIRDLRLGTPDLWQLTLPTATLGGGTYRPAAEGWRFARLSGAGAEIVVDRELFLAPIQPTAKDTTTLPPILAVRELELTASTIKLLDKSEPAALPLQLVEVTLTGRNLGQPAGLLGQIQISGSLEEGGQVRLDGGFSLNPFRGDLGLELLDLELAPLRPLLAPFLPPLLRAASLRGQGRLVFPTLRASGDLYLSELRNAATSEIPATFICDRAIFKDLTVTGRPLSLAARELLFIKPAIRVNRLVQKRAAPAAFLFPAHDDNPGAPVRIEIKTVNISDGSFILNDLSLDPDLEIGLTSISGRLSGMTNQPGQAAPFSLQARLHLNQTSETEGAVAPGQTARLNLQGEAALFGPAVTAQGSIQLKELDLVPLEPWLGELLGYQPLRGRADVAGNFTLAGQKIGTRQQLTVTGLGLGSSLSGRFNTPLTLALLSDPLERITLDLEIAGDQQSPYYSYAAGLAGEVRSRLSRTTVAPFTLLTDLAPDREGLDFIAFVPGTTDLAVGELAKLQTLAAILRQRPRLALAITGQADQLHDRAQNDPTPGPTRQTPLTVNGVDPTSSKELQELSRERGATVKGLLTRAGVSADRLRLTAADPDRLEEEILPDRPGNRADLGLELHPAR